MTVHSGMLTDTVVSLLMLLTVTTLCILTGPGTFDAMDGAELAVAGIRLEIPHSPGYPLLLWLLRVSGGRSYQELRFFSCLLSGLAAVAVYVAARSYNIGSPASSAASVLLVTSGAVLSQLNLLEVHGLSIILASIAIAFRRSRLGPYFFGMSVFGGHPLSFFLLPILLSRRWLRYWFLGLIPATMWFYVPVRGYASTVMHYGRPSGISGFIGYLSMYGGRISSPSLSGLGEFITAMGTVSCVAYLWGILPGKYRWRRFASVAGVLLVFLCYDVPDIASYSWLLLLPLSIQAAEGFQTLMGKSCKTLWIISIAVVLVLSSISGIYYGLDRRNDAMQMIVSDVLRGIPPDRVLCTTGGTSYYCAYMMEAEDRRPDLTALDRYGMVYSLSLLYGPIGTIPSETAGRYVYATEAWGSLPPSGVLFSMEGRWLDWNSYDVFKENMIPGEEITADMLAEMWCIRAFQETDESAASVAFDRALEYSESDMAKAAVEQLILIHGQTSNQ